MKNRKNPKLTEEMSEPKDQDKKVYLVTRGEYEDYTILAIFQSRSTAEIFRDQMKSAHCEMYVDPDKEELEAEENGRYEPEEIRVEEFDLDRSEHPVCIEYSGYYGVRGSPVLCNIRKTHSNTPAPSPKMWFKKASDGHDNHFSVYTDGGVKEAMMIAQNLSSGEYH